MLKILMSKTTEIGMSQIKRFLNVLTMHLYWDAFRREFLIDRKIFNKSCKA